jgi:RND superfamily putative drug exporter
MSYTLAVTFGLAAMIFGLLQWTIPVMAFSIICGLALDYGIFLLTRIREYRQNGFADDASFVKGVYRTGGVITSAGVIMCIAFGGLMLSKAKALKQFGLLLSFSVILDTFIIRCALVPALLSLFGKHVWWPRTVPEGLRGVDDVSDESMSPTAVRNHVSHIDEQTDTSCMSW